MVLDSICIERRDLDNCSIDSLSHVYGRRNKQEMVGAPKNGGA